MITVAGFNTSIDKRIDIHAFSVGEVNRADAVHATAGGKGLHVAQTAAALGEDVHLVGLIDAAHRTQVETHMRERAVTFHAVETPSIRNCLAVREQDGRMTELIEPGPALGAETRELLLQKFTELALRSDLAVISGSLPAGFTPDTYARLTRHVQAKGIRCLVDASDEVLRHVIEARPFMVKPNRDEARTLSGMAIDSIEAAVEFVHRLANLGIAMPVLSLGSKGAVSADRDTALHAHVELERAVNPVGSGDCLMAGIAVALARGHSPIEALQLGVACGAANAAALETGYATAAGVHLLSPQVRCRRI